MSKNKNSMKIKIDYSKIPNKFHLEVQKNTRMNIFRDRTKYNRKIKHKNNCENY